MIPVIANAMSRDRFYQLQVNFDIVDNLGLSDECKSTNRIRNRCKQIEQPPNAAFSIEKKMILFLERCELHQYVKNKPRPDGLKNYVVTISDGTVLDSEIYQGAMTPFLTKN